MTKKRHHKDKLYLNPSEYAESWGGYKGKSRDPTRCLRFDCCALTLLPFQDEIVGTQEGTLYDKSAIVSWLLKYKSDPTNGKPLARKDLFPVYFHKNEKGQFHCPITFKVFNEKSSIVCNRKSGNVYSKEAIDEVNRKANNWTDLITGEPFSVNDLILIQDPSKIQNKRISEFEHVKNDLNVQEEVDQVLSKLKMTSKNPEAAVKGSGLLSRVLSEVEKIEDKKKKEFENVMQGYEESSSDEFRAPNTETSKKLKSNLYTKSGAAASLTSTAVIKETKVEYRDLTDMEHREKLYGVVKKHKLKCHVKLRTSLGDLNVELRSDLVPETCHNFILHCQRGRYDRTIFHRIIPKFMAQGGDPLGNGTGGSCAFKGMDSFRDDFHPALRHNARGVLSMANSGIDSNKQQYFILFRPAPHLDDLHTVFGTVTQGLEVLDKFERLPRDNRDRPLTPPVLLQAIIFTDAYSDAVKVMEGKKIGEADIQDKQKRSAIFGLGSDF